ncbi:MAG: ABC transporter substrate-binding protein [Chloroflexota bacterium]
MATIVTRRNFIRLVGAASTGLLVAACSAAPAAQPTVAPVKPAGAPPTAAPAAAAPQTAPAAPAGATAGQDWQAQWDTLVEGAKREGKVVVQTPAGAGYRESVDEFAKAFPGIEADHQPFPDSATYIPKITSERQAGIYSVDVLATTVTPLLQVLKPQGFLDPVRPLFIRPDVMDDKVWYQGFEGRWADLTKSHVFRFGVSVTRPIYVNTGMIEADAIKTIDDLLDPKWKGKIVTSDLVQGYVYTPSTIIREDRGEAFLHKLFVEQEPLIIRDRRQAIESLIRGAVPIGFGLHPVIMSDFVKDGLAKDIRNLDFFGYGGGEVAGIYNKAPHPMAGKLFLNWLLTKEGQGTWTKGSHQNSARLDVPPVDPSTAPGSGRTIDPTQEDWLVKTGDTQEYLKKLQSERPAN